MLPVVAVPGNTPGNGATLAVHAPVPVRLVHDHDGLTLAAVFTDVRGRTESGLYRLLTEVRRRNVVAVLVPDLDHLQHAGCLAGADVHTATRYLRARVLPVASVPGPVAERLPPADGGTPSGDSADPWFGSYPSAKVARA